MFIIFAFCVKCQINLLKITRHFFKNGDASSVSNLQRLLHTKSVKIYNQNSYKMKRSINELGDFNYTNLLFYTIHFSGFVVNLE